MIKFRCKCGQKISVPDEAIGRRCKCPKCQNITRVPSQIRPSSKSEETSGLAASSSPKTSSVCDSIPEYIISEPEPSTQMAGQIDPGISFTEAGDVVFKGPFNYVFNLVTQTIEELGGKVVKEDSQKGYIEGKYKYGINLFGIRVCVSVIDEGQQCIINFKGKLKDAFDTFGHAKKKAKEVKTRFLHKLETLTLQVDEQTRQDSHHQGSPPAMPQSNTVYINTVPSYPTRDAHYDDEALGVGWVVLGWCMALFIPLVGLILGIVCCTKKRVGNGVGMILLSIFMFLCVKGR